MRPWHHSETGFRSGRSPWQEARNRGVDDACDGWRCCICWPFVAATAARQAVGTSPYSTCRWTGYPLDRGPRSLGNAGARRDSRAAMVTPPPCIVRIVVIKLAVCRPRRVDRVAPSLPPSARELERRPFWRLCCLLESWPILAQQRFIITSPLCPIPTHRNPRPLILFAPASCALYQAPSTGISSPILGPRNSCPVVWEQPGLPARPVVDVRSWPQRASDQHHQPPRPITPVARREWPHTISKSTSKASVRTPAVAKVETRSRLDLKMTATRIVDAPGPRRPSRCLSRSQARPRRC